MVISVRPGGRLPFDAGQRLLHVLPPLVVALAVTLIIGPGLMPDVGFWDTGEFQTVLPIMGTAHPTGYPTYVLLGFAANLLLAPLGEEAFRINVLSLLCVAVAAAATVRLVARLTGVVPVAMAAGLGVALATYTWRLATHADPHTLHLALVAILLVFLVRWEGALRAREGTADRWLVGAAVVYGLSVGNHSLTLLLALPVGLYVLSVQPRILLRPRFLAVCTLALVGTIVAVYLELPLRAGPFRAPLVYAKPDTWDGFWYIALAEQFRGSLNDPLGDLPRKVGELSGLAVAQFGFLAPLIPVGFLATALRHWHYALLTGSAMVITLIFNASYTNADISRYYLGPSLWAWTWLAVFAAMIVEQLGGAVGDEQAGETHSEPGTTPVGSGSWRAGDSGGARLGALLTGVIALALLVPTATAFSSRAEQADLSHDTAARRWVTAALSEIEADAVVVSWWSTSTVLWYAQHVDGLRPDLTIVDDRTRLDLDYGEATDVIARFLDTRPVYVIRANENDLNLVLALYDLEPLAGESASNVYRVLGPRGTGG